MKRKILDFSVMKEEITQNNVLEMAELIALMELRFQIGYLGSRAQKMYADMYADIKHKNELGYMLSDSYDLVQEGEFSYSNFTARLRVNNALVSSKYLYLVLNDYYQRKKTFGYQNGMGGLKNLDMDRYMDIPIPVPPIDIQNQIIAECEKIDEEYNTTRMSIESYRKKIEDLFNELDVISTGGGGIS